MANRIKGITVEIGGDTTKLSKALENVNSTIKGTQAQLKDVEKLLKLDPKNTELLSQKQKLLAESISATKDKLATLRTVAEQANEALSKGEITQQQYDALQREIVETEQALQSLESSADKTTSALKKIGDAGEVLQNFGKKVSDVGGKLTTNVTVPITTLGTLSAKTAADFDSAMSKVSAVSGATGEELDALRDKAREMGSKTKFSASEAAEAMNYMAMAGWKTADMISGIDGIMSLAAASGEDLATTSDIVTDALTAFGLTSKDSGHFADILAAASSNANTNVAMMGETFKYAAPVAGAFGFTVEDTAEAIGLMANAGIKSDQAGTSLRSTMLALSSDIELCGENLGEVTIKTTNTDGSMRSLGDILADCRVAFSQLSESEQAAAGEMLVGKNALSGFLALMNAAPPDIDKLSSAIANCDGTSLRMSETMQNNLNGQLTILKSQLEELAISFGEILMPILRNVVTKIQEFTDKLNSMDPAVKETIVRIALVVAALGPLLLIIGKLITTIGSLMSFIGNMPTIIANAKTAFSTLGTAISGISAPVIAVTALITALISAFVYLWNTNKDFKNSILSIWEKIKSTFDRLTSGIVERLNALGFNFESFGDIVTTIWRGFCDILAPLFEGAFSNVAIIFDTLVDVILGILDTFIGLFTGDWEQCWSGLKGIFVGIWDLIVDIFKNILKVLENVADMFFGWFGTSWSEVWTSIKEFFVEIWNGIINFITKTFKSINDFFVNTWAAIKNFFIGIWTNISDFVTNTMSSIHDTITAVWNVISSAIATVMDTIKNTIFTVWNTIYDFISPLLEAFKYLFETIFEAIHIIISRIMDWISEKIHTIWNAIVGFISPLLENLKIFFETIWNGISTAISTTLDTISNVIYDVWNTVSNFISEILNSIWSVILSIWNSISTTISNILNGIKENISAIWNTINATISNIMNTIKNTIISIWESVKTAISNTIEGIYNTVKSGFDKAVSFVKNLAGEACGWGSDIIAGIVSGIRSKIDSVASAVTDVANKIRSFLHFSVPDEGPLTDFETWMPDFMQGLANGIKSNSFLVHDALNIFGTDISNFLTNSFSTTMNNILSTVSVGWDSVKNVFSTANANVRDIISNVWNSIPESVRNSMCAINDSVLGIWNNVRNGVGDRLWGISDTIWNAMENAKNVVMEKVNTSWYWGYDLMQNLVNGIRYMIADIYNAVCDVANIIWEYLHFTVPEKGPLTSVNEWMPDFMENLANGINKNKKLITKAISGVADVMSLDINTDFNMTTSMKDNNPYGTVVNNYNNSRTVNQTNNSPKSLSRLEIYRQTRNALGT